MGVLHRYDRERAEVDSLSLHDKTLLASPVQETYAGHPQRLHLARCAAHPGAVVRADAAQRGGGGGGPRQKPRSVKMLSIGNLQDVDAKLLEPRVSVRSSLTSTN